MKPFLAFQVAAFGIFCAAQFVLIQCVRDLAVYLDRFGTAIALAQAFLFFAFGFSIFVRFSRGHTQGTAYWILGMLAIAACPASLLLADSPFLGMLRLIAPYPDQSRLRSGELALAVFAGIGLPSLLGGCATGVAISLANCCRAKPRREFVSLIHFLLGSALAFLTNSMVGNGDRATRLAVACAFILPGLLSGLYIIRSGLRKLRPLNDHLTGVTGHPVSPIPKPSRLLLAVAFLLGFGTTGSCSAWLLLYQPLAAGYGRAMQGIMPWWAALGLTVGVLVATQYDQGFGGSHDLRLRGWRLIVLLPLPIITWGFMPTLVGVLARHTGTMLTSEAFHLLSVIGSLLAIIPLCVAVGVSLACLLAGGAIAAESCPKMFEDLVGRLAVGGGAGFLFSSIIPEVSGIWEAVSCCTLALLMAVCIYHVSVDTAIAEKALYFAGAFAVVLALGRDPSNKVIRSITHAALSGRSGSENSHVIDSGYGSCQQVILARAGGTNFVIAEGLLVDSRKTYVHTHAANARKEPVDWNVNWSDIGQAGSVVLSRQTSTDSAPSEFCVVSESRLFHALLMLHNIPEQTLHSSRHVVLYEQPWSFLSRTTQVYDSIAVREALVSSLVGGTFSSTRLAGLLHRRLQTNGVVAQRIAHSQISRSLLAEMISAFAFTFEDCAIIRLSESEIVLLACRSALDLAWGNTAKAIGGFAAEGLSLTPEDVSRDRLRGHLLRQYLLDRKSLTRFIHELRHQESPVDGAIWVEGNIFGGRACRSVFMERLR